MKTKKVLSSLCVDGNGLIAAHEGDAVSFGGALSAHGVLAVSGDVEVRRRWPALHKRLCCSAG